METTNAPLSSASLTIMPMPARLAAAAAALEPPAAAAAAAALEPPPAAAAELEPPPLLLDRTGSAGGDDVSVSAACRPLLDAATSIVQAENRL